MRNWLAKFMYGRYGNDELNRFLSFLAIALLLVSLIPGLIFIYPVGIAMFIYSIFRSMSKNTPRRLKERETFLKLGHKIKNFFTSRKKRFSQRKTHIFFKCSSCKQWLSVPRGKGKVRVDCPKCHNSFEKIT